MSRVRGAVIDDVVQYPDGKRYVRRGVLFENPPGVPESVRVIYTPFPSPPPDPSPEQGT